MRKAFDWKRSRISMLEVEKGNYEAFLPRTSFIFMYLNMRGGGMVQTFWTTLLDRNFSFTKAVYFSS
jgi:hypothetical protein